MTSPVKARLNQVFEDYGISGHYKIYDLLKTQGLMESKDHIANFFGSDGLPGMIELPFRDRNVTILIMPSMPEKGRKHRIYIKCDCGKAVPFGRLGQHKCKTVK